MPLPEPGPQMPPGYTPPGMLWQGESGGAKTNIPGPDLSRIQAPMPASPPPDIEALQSAGQNITQDPEMMEAVGRVKAKEIIGLLEKQKAPISEEDKKIIKEEGKRNFGWLNNLGEIVSGIGVMFSPSPERIESHSRYYSALRKELEQKKKENDSGSNLSSIAREALEKILPADYVKKAKEDGSWETITYGDGVRSIPMLGRAIHAVVQGQYAKGSLAESRGRAQERLEEGASLSRIRNYAKDSEDTATLATNYQDLVSTLQDDKTKEAFKQSRVPFFGTINPAAKERITRVRTKIAALKAAFARANIGAAQTETEFKRIEEALEGDWVKNPTVLFENLDKLGQIAKGHALRLETGLAEREKEMLRQGPGLVSDIIRGRIEEPEGTGAQGGRNINMPSATTLPKEWSDAKKKRYLELKKRKEEERSRMMQMGM